MSRRSCRQVFAHLPQTLLFTGPWHRLHPRWRVLTRGRALCPVEFQHQHLVVGRLLLVVDQHLRWLLVVDKRLRWLLDVAPCPAAARRPVVAWRLLRARAALHLAGARRLLAVLQRSRLRL